MKPILNILKKFNPDFSEYIELINIASPILFLVKLHEEVKIGFVNTYRPVARQVSFVLSDVSYNDVINCIDENKSVRDLFQESLVRYEFNKGETKLSDIELSGSEEYLPHQELKIEFDIFNRINIADVRESLCDLQQSIIKDFYIEESLSYNEFKVEFDIRDKDFIFQDEIQSQYTDHIKDITYNVGLSSAFSKMENLYIKEYISNKSIVSEESLVSNFWDNMDNKNVTNKMCLIICGENNELRLSVA